MTSSSSRRLRVALAAAPQLLSDSLRSLLCDDVDVIIVPDGSDESFDVALVTHDDGRLRADVVIVLDDTATSRGGATVQSSAAEPTARLEDLAAVLAFVRHTAGDPRGEGLTR